MTLINFQEANKILTKPKDWTDEECSSLLVFNNGEQSISCWGLSWREKLHCLFRGTIWLPVYSGSTAPPVSLNAVKTVFSRNPFEEQQNF